MSQRDSATARATVPPYVLVRAVIHVRREGEYLRNGLNFMWARGLEVILHLETATRYWSAGFRWSTRSWRFHPRYQHRLKADVPQWVHDYMERRR